MKFGNKKWLEPLIHKDFENRHMEGSYSAKAADYVCHTKIKKDQ
jgi:hypothetical protein